MLNQQECENMLDESFTKSFNEEAFLNLCSNLLPKMELARSQTSQIGDSAYKQYEGHFKSFKNIGRYKNSNTEKIEVLIVNLNKETTLSRARSAQRNFVVKYLSGHNRYPDAAIVAFVSPNENDWRFSFVRVRFGMLNHDTKKYYSPARRYSFLAGSNESTHTARKQLIELLLRTGNELPSLDKIEDAFSVEKVTQEFFAEYKKLLERLVQTIDNNKAAIDHFEQKGIKTIDFAKKLLGQIVFLYFIQKKGWLGVVVDDKWGSGSKKFLSEEFNNKATGKFNFFKDILEPLFYKALNTKRENDYYESLDCKIPFLNGGLFEPYKNYDWQNIDIALPNSLFSNRSKEKHFEGDGILDIFNRYNFTVNEDDPLNKEVAVDPEVLGKAFESLQDRDINKATGTFYTPREIVHYMCQESLLLYLDKEAHDVSKEDLKQLIRYDEGEVGTKDLQNNANNPELPKSIETNAELIDTALATVKVCDPAVGSGAFPVECMNVIVKIRTHLNDYISKDDSRRSAYYFKLNCIEKCLHGIDIEDGAVEIAKLRLWLSLIVDEENPDTVKPLPNLDYKIIRGNALIGHMEENLFSKEELRDLEKLRARYFLQRSGSRKNEIRRTIASIRNKLVTVAGGITFKVDFSEAFSSDKKGFDIVIANPPYIGEKDHKHLFIPVKLEKEGLGRFYHGKMDYLFFFFHLALDISCPSAVITFITPSYYVTAYGGPNLRNDLWKRSIIRRLINFNEHRIFHAAQGHHSMISILTKREESDSPDMLADISIASGTDLKKGELSQILMWNDNNTQDFKQDFKKSQRKLYDTDDEKYIYLNDSKSQEILDLISARGTYLGELLFIRNGIQTAADYVDMKTIKKYGLSATEGEGVFVISDKKLIDISINDEEKEFIKPWFKSTDISHYYSQGVTSKNVIYINKNIDSSKIPAIMKHLSRFKNKLSDRTEFRSGRRCWYELHRTRDSFLFEGPKIIVPFKNKKNIFAYNEGTWYASGDVYFMKPKSKHQDVSLKYIVALLNSRLYYFWLYHRGKLKGQDLELYGKPLEKTPIKKIIAKEQEPFIQLVDSILEISKDSTLMSESAKEKIRKYHQQINELVYKLYGLSDKQIEVVETLTRKNGVHDLFDS